MKTLPFFLFLTALAIIAPLISHNVLAEDCESDYSADDQTTACSGNTIQTTYTWLDANECNTTESNISTEYIKTNYTDDQICHFSCLDAECQNAYPPAFNIVIVAGLVLGLITLIRMMKNSEDMKNKVLAIVLIIIGVVIALTMLAP